MAAYYAVLAQTAEQPARNGKVPRSIPGDGSNFPSTCLPWGQRLTGSRPHLFPTMKYTSTITHQFSKCPAVSFTVRHLTEGRRIKIQLALADKYDKVDAIQRSAAEIARRVKPELEDIQAKAKAGDSSPVEWSPDMLALFRSNDRIEAVNRDEILPFHVKELLVSVDGLEIDGVPATPETAVEIGPPELYAEISRAVKHEMGMDEQEKGNSESPSTSNAPVDGATPATSATSASDAATTA